MNKILIALILNLLAFNAFAINRALLIGVGQYQVETANLPGIELDIGMMQEVAQLLGYNEIKTLQNQQATLKKVEHAFSTWLVDGIKKDDKVLIYYSGHGTTVADKNDDEADGQDEALTLYDMKLNRRVAKGVLIDDRFHELLNKIPSQHILVFIDACYSGTATRNFSSAGIMGKKEFVPKVYRWEGMEELTDNRTFKVEPKKSEVSENVITLSAAQDNEESIATTEGSLFTVGLHEIIRQAAANNTELSPQVIQQHVSDFIKTNVAESELFHPQLSGNTELLQLPINMQRVDNGNGITMQRLTEVLKQAQPLTIKLNQDEFKVGDKLLINVDIKQAGYLNIIDVNAKDEATVLFPNAYHQDNEVKIGDFKLPTHKMDFDLKANEPLGRSFIIAFLTPDKVNLYENGFSQRDSEGKLSELFKVLSESGLQELSRAFVVIAKPNNSHAQKPSVLQAGMVETRVCSAKSC